MKFVRFDYSAGLCGTEGYEFGRFDDDITEEEISDVAQQICETWCESYGINVEAEEEESGVEYEYDYSWKFVGYDEVEEYDLVDYTN
jgi:hypothetical protein